MPVYYTQYNGGRPYEVTVSGKSIVVKKHNVDDNTYNEVVFSKRNCRQIFVGCTSPTEFAGNSFLVETKRKTYVHIGRCIYRFITADEITNYESPMGNSNVPYPYAYGTENTYLMLEHVYIPNILRMADDPYQQYYGFVRNYVNPKHFGVSANRKPQRIMKIEHGIRKYYDDNYQFDVTFIDGSQHGYW